VLNQTSSNWASGRVATENGKQTEPQRCHRALQRDAVNAVIDDIPLRIIAGHKQYNRTSQQRNQMQSGNLTIRLAGQYQSLCNSLMLSTAMLK